MEIIREEFGYKIYYNGTNSFFVCNEHEDCIFGTISKIKANNFLNRVLSNARLI